MFRILRNKGFWALLLTVALLAMLAVPTLPALALTTADVTVNATPSFIAITCNYTALGYGFGVVAVSTNYSSDLGQFGITNLSTVQTDQTISVTGTNWTGGIEWIHSDTATPGVDTVALFSSKDGGAFDVIVKNAAPNYIYENCGITTNYSFELRLSTPTAFSDGTLKTNTLRITAAAG